VQAADEEFAGTREGSGRCRCGGAGCCPCCFTELHLQWVLCSSWQQASQMGLIHELFPCQFARKSKFRPRTAAEIQLKDVFFFLKKVQTVQNPGSDRKTVRAHHTVLSELLWSLVNSGPYKLVSTYPYSLNFGSVSAARTGLTLCALGRHARLFSRIEFLLFVQIMSLNQCSHLRTKSRANKFIFKTQLLQNALTRVWHVQSHP